MIIVAIIFIVIGTLIKYGKMYFLIAGYNNMSKEEKAKYNIKGIVNVFRNTLFSMAFMLIIVNIIAKRLENPLVETAGLFVIVIIGVAYLLVQSNSSKYRIDKDQIEK